MSDLIDAEVQNLKAVQDAFQKQVQDLNNDFIRKSLALVPELYTASIVLTYLASYQIPQPWAKGSAPKMRCFDTYSVLFLLKDKEGRVLVETSRYKGFDKDTHAVSIQVEEKADFGDPLIIKSVLPGLSFFFEALGQFLTIKTQVPFKILKNTYIEHSKHMTWNEICEANPNIAPIIKQMISNVTVKEKV